jgi:ParB/RepB/Spo0J family partition protein
VLALLRPSPTNPRKTFPEESLRGLANTIAEHGVLNPLLVRPRGTPGGNPVTFRGGTWHHLDHFEVVDGERRLRAVRDVLQQDGPLPVTVRNLTDRQVLVIQTVANDQREDVRPSEQAAAYARLVAAGMTVDEVATVTGKSATFVRGLIDLARLPAWALAAVDDGLFPRTTAARIARLGERSREQAAARAITGQVPPVGSDVAKWVAKVVKDGTAEPMASRQIRKMLQSEFTRELKTAAFFRKGLDLLPEFRACGPCPDRAGNDPEAQADGVREDMCLNPDCFRQKVEAFKAAEVAKAAAEGIEPAPEEVNGHGHPPPKGWCDLEAKLWQTELNKDGAGSCEKSEGRLGTVLGKKHCPQKYLAFDQNDRPRTLVKTAEARKTLQDIGVLKKPEKAKPVDKPAAKSAGARTLPIADRYGARVQRAAFIAANILAEYGEEQFAALTPLDDAEEGGPILDALRLVARVRAYGALVSGDRISATKDVLKARFPGIKAQVGSHIEDEKIIDGILSLWNAPKLLAFLLQLATTEEVEQDGPRRRTAEDLLAWAELDWAQLTEQARRELAGGETADEKIERAEREMAESTTEATAPDPEAKPAAAETIEPAAPSAPLVQDMLLAGLPNFPDQVLDALEAKGVRGVCQLRDLADLNGSDRPPREVLAAWLRRLPGVKAGPADDAAAAVVAYLQAAEPTAPEEPAPTKGEPIDALGVTSDQLNDAYAAAKLAQGKTGTLARVPHVEINGRPHIVLACLEGYPEKTLSWEVRPLHEPGLFAHKHLGVRLRTAPGSGEADLYAGVRVEARVGRGVDPLWQELVIGPKGEQRRLIQVPAKAPKGKKVKA